LVGIDYAVKAAFAVCPDGLLDYFRCNGFGQFHAVKLADKICNLRIFEDAITFKIALMVVKYMKYMESFEF